MMFFFSGVLTRATRVILIKKGCYSQEKCWFVDGICLIQKLVEYTNDYRPGGPIICTLKLKQIFSGKNAVNLISIYFTLPQRYMPEINTKETKQK